MCVTETYEGIEFDWVELDPKTGPLPQPRVKPMFPSAAGVTGEWTAAAKAELLGAYEEIKGLMTASDIEHLGSPLAVFIRLVWDRILPLLDEDQQVEFLLRQRRWVSESQCLLAAFNAGKLSRKPRQRPTEH